jgi:hypothetical protein
MARARCTFKQSDLTRALKGARAAGVEVARIKIAKNGTIEIDAGKPQEAAAVDDLDRELTAFEARNGQG